MDKKIIDQDVGQQEVPTLQSEWNALNDSDLAVVGGGCTEATPY